MIRAESRLRPNITIANTRPFFLLGWPLCDNEVPALGRRGHNILLRGGALTSLDKLLFYEYIQF
jgi:hypothetical protein